MDPQPLSSEDTFPLHRLVWDNRFQELDRALQTGDHDKEALDPRGRTPLMLAVTLGHLESIRVLLRHGTNVNVINRGGWTVVQEAVAIGDPELLQLVLERRDRQRYTSRVGGIPDLLQKLKSAPDFYVEMKWEFTSWVPFLSRACPSDTYRVYKRGSNVRVDTTLLGFDQNSWVRGSRTYVFSGREDGADLYEIDHDTRAVYCEEMRLLSQEEVERHAARHSAEAVSARLVTPLVLTYLDTDKIDFERSKNGLFWGWGGQERTEMVGQHQAKVFGARNVELVTKTRTEHLTEEDKKRAKAGKNPLQSFLGMAEAEVKQQSKANKNVVGDSSETFSANNPCCISQVEYFDPTVDFKGRDIGRPKEMTCRVQKFQAQLWLCEDFPLSLQEQVMPIVDLMAVSNTHFQKLRDFITCSLPAGFPVKIEIPLFHVLNARVTFGNIFGSVDPVEGVSVVGGPVVDGGENEDDRKVSCVLDDSVFAIPEDYSRIGVQTCSEQARRQWEGDDDDQLLLQYALRQSGGDGAENGIPEDMAREEVDIWEALQAQAPSSQQSDNGHVPARQYQSYEDQQLELQIQRAIEMSLASANEQQRNCTVESASSPAGQQQQPSGLVIEDDLAKAIRISQEESDEQRRRLAEEEEMLRKVLELSLQEK